MTVEEIGVCCLGRVSQQVPQGQESEQGEDRSERFTWDWNLLLDRLRTQHSVQVKGHVGVQIQILDLRSNYGPPEDGPSHHRKPVYSKPRTSGLGKF